MEKYLNQLTNFFEKYWESLTLNKWEYLYKSWEEDNNLYLLLEGEWQWQINNKPIFKIYWPEVSGEKSFLEKKGKPIDFLITSDKAKIYKLSPDIFKKLNQNLKNEFLKLLNLYISSRVYKLNAVLDLVKKLNNISLSENTNIEILKKLLNIENMIILKQINEDLIFITWDFFPTEEIFKLINQEEKNIKIGKNYIIIKLKNYIIFWSITKSIDRYILSNAILYSLWTLKYICHILEQAKNQKLENTIKTQVF